MSFSLCCYFESQVYLLTLSSLCFELHSSASQQLAGSSEYVVGCSAIKTSLGCLAARLVAPVHLTYATSAKGLSDFDAQRKP